jgi:hypothetical protein
VLIYIYVCVRRGGRDGGEMGDLGQSFQGFPIQFNTRSAERMLHSMLQNSACSDIVATRGDQVRFGLRVKIVPYPENVCAVWVMIAVKFKPAD